MHLHALLDDWIPSVSVGAREMRNLPSKGFMRASLEIVAAAPLAASFS
jgi:hypothetical protein